MKKIAIIGSGLASTSIAKSLIKRGVKPIIFDIGQKLDSERQKIVDRMSNLEPEDWDEEDRLIISENPTVSAPYKFPKKLYFGSDFFYANSIKELPLSSDDYPPQYTHAKGGLSVGWGASVLPPHNTDLNDWPIDSHTLHPFFKEVLDDLPYSAVDDNLNKYFPTFVNSHSALEMSKATKKILDDFNKSKLKDMQDVAFGRSRLLVHKYNDALNIGCKMCGHCMSGCVYGSIYKASQDIKKLQSDGLIDYRDNSIVKKVNEDDGKNKIYYLDSEKVLKTIEVDKIFIGAGAIGTSRLVLESRMWFDEVLKCKANNGFVIPLIRFRKLPFEWPRINTMPSIFFEFKVPGLSNNWIHSQISTPNELVYQKLDIDSAQNSFLKNTKRYLSRHLITSVCNLHSNHSNGYFLTLKKSKNNNLNSLESVREEDEKVPIKFKKTISRFSSYMKYAGYYALTPMVQNSIKVGGGHLGGTFPMNKNPKNKFQTDILGRLSGWENIHIIDSSIFPSLPGTTIGLLAMANARRIGNEVSLTK